MIQRQWPGDKAKPMQSMKLNHPSLEAGQSRILVQGREHKQNKWLKLKESQSLELNTCIKPVILVMIREESFKGVPKLAQKDQETEKCIFSSTVYSVFKLTSSLSKIRIKSVSEYSVCCCYVVV